MIMAASFEEWKTKGKDNSSDRDLEGLRVIVITMRLTPVVESVFHSRHSLVGIIECAPRLDKRKTELNLFTLAKSIYRYFQPKPISLKSFCKKNMIPYYYMDNVSNRLLEGWIKTLNPDLITVYTMSHLLKKNIYLLPKYGTINLHPSLLPKYRGPNPWFWQYYYLDFNPGVTVHYIDEYEDTGDIIYQQSYEMLRGESFSTVYDQAINKIGIPMLLRAMDDIYLGDAPRMKQPRMSSTHRARNVRDDELSRIIEWDNWPVERIWHILHGPFPWFRALPRPCRIFLGPCWNIGEYEKMNMDDYVPGTCYQENGQRFVACRDGKIYLRARFKWCTNL